MNEVGTPVEGETPRHGFQGERAGPKTAAARPCVAVSREAGARGTTIANRVSQRLGWQVYTQELLDYLAMNDGAQAQLRSELPPDAIRWADAQLERLKAEKVVTATSELGELPRVLLMLAARGGVILVGRGAGYLLPSESTLHVRVVSPLPERIAYIAQSARMTREQAAEEVRRRDYRRAEFLAASLRRPPAESHAFDMVLNSGRLGEDLCAAMVVAGLKGKFPPPESDHGE